VETCLYFDDGGEDMTLPCGILDLNSLKAWGGDDGSSVRISSRGEHECTAADPARVETCPYFDAYTESGEDVTLPCRILNLVGEGGG